MGATDTAAFSLITFATIVDLRRANFQILLCAFVFNTIFTFEQVHNSRVGLAHKSSSVFMKLSMFNFVLGIRFRKKSVSVC